MPDVADTRTTLTGLGLLTGLAAATATGGNDVLVDVGGTQITAHTLRAASVTINDPLLIARQGSVYWVLGPANTVAPPPPLPVEVRPVPPPPKPTTRTGKLIISPTNTGSYRDGAWRSDTDDTYQGQYGSRGNYTGAAFYGRKAQSLTGATCTAAYVRLKREKGSGDYGARQVTLWTCSQTARPAGNVSRISSTTGPSMKVDTTTTFTLPTAWGQSFIDGSVGSLACYDADGDPYLRLAGRESWSTAWVLQINWRKVG